MWPRKKSTPQTVTGTDKEWSQTGTLVHKPPRGWLHSDSSIIDGTGVCYCVQYVGLMQILKSMRSLKYEDRTAVTREAMMRCVEESGVRAVKKRKVGKHIAKMLGGRPQVTRAGTNVNLRISIDGLKLTVVNTGELIADHGMPSISFATGGEGEGIDFIGYVAKDTINDRACHCFDCGDLAYDIITTIGQAFELRYKTYLTTKAVPLEIPGFGEGRGSGMGFDDDTSQTLPHSNIPPPPRRGALPSIPSDRPNPPGAYDTLNDKSNVRKRTDNYYDADMQGGTGTGSGASAAAAMATHGSMSLKRMDEDVGYSAVRDNGASSRSSGVPHNPSSSYDNPNLAAGTDGGNVTYDDPESSDRVASLDSYAQDQTSLNHATAGKRPSNNPSFDDSIYDNSVNGDAAGGGGGGARGSGDGLGQNGHHHHSHLPPAGAFGSQLSNRSSGEGAAHVVHGSSNVPPLLTPPSAAAALAPGHPSQSPLSHMTPTAMMPSQHNAASAASGHHHRGVAMAAANQPSSAGGRSNGHVHGPGGGGVSAPVSNVHIAPARASEINHDLMAHDWFHGILSRDEAENILEEDGEFLVRESVTQAGQYVLSGMENRRVKHLLLVDPEGVVRTRDRVFASVPELIHYHIEHSLPIVSSGSSLTLGTAVVIDMSQE